MDVSMLEFRRTDDEVVVVNYMYYLHVLLAQPRAMEREFFKLRQLNPKNVIMLDCNANLNDSNFIKRLDDSFQYYSTVFHGIDEYDFRLENYRRREIGNIVGCEGRNRIVRYETLTQ
ncbi:hypothetical protein PTKIN_Ptkin09bG0269200 [Pterospermum kingtungense]